MERGFNKMDSEVEPFVDLKILDLFLIGRSINFLKLQID
jgi:hypothetical protein